MARIDKRLSDLERAAIVNTRPGPQCAMIIQCAGYGYYLLDGERMSAEDFEQRWPGYDGYVIRVGVDVDKM